MTEHSLIQVINPTSYMCGQQGILEKINKGMVYLYEVKIKGRHYKFMKNDIAEVLLTIDDLRNSKVLGTLGELTQRG